MKNLLRSYPITANDWLKYHPYTRTSLDDHYYLKLCNRLLKANINESLCRELSWSAYKDLTGGLVAWFEDVISETNIWRSFTGEHLKRYGKYLPFYDTQTDYYDDEINLQDIQFLIWHFISIQLGDKFVDPFNRNIRLFAEAVFEIMEEEYEWAPQNIQFKKMMFVPEHKDIFGTRNIMEFLTFGTYLNRHSGNRKLDRGIKIIEETDIDPQYLGNAIYDCRVMYVINTVSPMLALRSNEQLANIIGETHPRYHEIKSLSKRISATCVVESKDETHLYIRHVATGKRFNLVLSTVSPGLDKLLDTAGKRQFWVNMVEWGDEWALMGMLLTGKRSEDRRPEKHLFDPIEPKLKELEFYEICFRDLTDGSPITYFETANLYIDFIDQLRIHTFQKANPGKEIPPHETYDPSQKNIKNAVLFFNHHVGTELHTDLAQGINDPRNPYYLPGTKTDIEELIINKNVSAQFVEYLLTKQMINIDPNKEMDDRIIIDNLDFLLRYYKQDDYHSDPRIASTE